MKRLRNGLRKMVTPDAAFVTRIVIVIRSLNERKAFLKNNQRLIHMWIFILHIC